MDLMDLTRQAEETTEEYLAYNITVQVPGIGLLPVTRAEFDPDMTGTLTLHVEPSWPQTYTDGDGEVWHHRGDGLYSFGPNGDGRWSIALIRETYGASPAGK